KYKPSPEVWSIAECAEHIVLSEDFLFGVSQQMLKAPAADRLPTSNPETDQKLVAAVKDRSHKAKAPEQIAPNGKFPTPADAAREFEAKRARNLEYAKNTTDDLRLHTTRGPIGPMDAYQFLLLMAVHTSRHTAQLNEVKTNSTYPKDTALLIRSAAR